MKFLPQNLNGGAILISIIHSLTRLAFLMLLKINGKAKVLKYKKKYFFLFLMKKGWFLASCNRILL